MHSAYGDWLRRMIKGRDALSSDTGENVPLPSRSSDIITGITV